jgi:uncharacterized 2Fe-2S/4Fe-4S cluster protein (DUF4445 family)
MSRYTASGLSFLLDGEEVPMAPGDTVLQAAHRVGRYIPTCAGTRACRPMAPAACAW